MTRLRALTTIAFAFAAVPLAAQTPVVAPVASAPAPLTPAEEARFLALGKTYTRWFLGGKADSLLAVMAPEAAEKLGGIDGVRDMMNQVAERAGVETKVTEEKMTRRKGTPQFWHAGQFSEFADDELVLRWIFDADGKITGAGFGPKGGTPAPDAP